MLSNEFSDANVRRHGEFKDFTRTCVMKFKDFQAPVLFSSTFKALNLGEKIQVLSRIFKDAWEPCHPPTMLDSGQCPPLYKADLRQYTTR